jgi:hypothetical protein
MVARPIPPARTRDPNDGISVPFGQGKALMTCDDELVSPEFRANPCPPYHRLRAEAPVHWSKV